MNRLPASWRGAIAVSIGFILIATVIILATPHLHPDGPRGHQGATVHNYQLPTL
ncbi:MAG: hypothetical protein ABJB03_00365 [Rhodoglobus sp.]